MSESPILTEFKYFKDENGGIFAFAIDGSQDSYIDENLTFVETSEIKDVLVPPYNLDNVINDLKSHVDGVYTIKMDMLSVKYPPAERETWPKQLAEAQIIVSGGSEPTPFIDACIGDRPLTRLEFAQKIIANDANYTALAGALTGARQAHIESIGAVAKLPESAARAAADVYDVEAFWPEDEIDA